MRRAGVIFRVMLTGAIAASSFLLSGTVRAAPVENAVQIKVVPSRS